MDEPTGGLDVSVQARLLDLIRGLVADLALSVVIVTHDLGGGAPAVAPHAGHAARPRGRERASPTRCWTTRSTPTASCSSPRSCRPETMSAPDRVEDLRQERSPCICRTAWPSRSSTASSFAVGPGECVVLAGASGQGKSTRAAADLRQLPGAGRPHPAPPRRRGRSIWRTPRRAWCWTCAGARWAMSASSCACVPRVPALDVVAEPLLALRRGARGERASGPRRCCAGCASPSGCWRCRRRPSPAASSSASTSRAASSTAILAIAARRADRVAGRGEPGDGGAS